MANITNYYELINAFRAFADDHKQIKCFGYGTLTDIESPVDPSTGLTIQRDYPYMFINPTNHTYTQSMLTFRFNVIVMELTSETTPMGFPGIHTTIKAQSDALQILNDFMAWLEYNDDFDTELVKNTGFTPFQERFQDTVAGMTATIEIQIPNRLNLCDAPIYDDEQLILAVQNLNGQTISWDPNYTPTLSGTAVYDTKSWWDSSQFRTVDAEEPVILGTVELRANVSIVPNAGDPFPAPFTLELYSNVGASYLQPDEVQWPTEAQWGHNVPVKLVWHNVDVQYINPSTYGYFQISMVIDGSYNQSLVFVDNMQIKFYKTV